MKEMLRVLKSVVNKYFVLGSLSMASMLFSVSDVLAQFPLVKRQVWDGPFDIRMVASANLDPVFINPTQAASSILLADSLITTKMMRRSGDLGFHINNEYARQSPFTDITNHNNVPKSIFLCGDPEVGGCLQGLTTTTPNSTCPVKKYNGPDYISSGLYVSMTYADYDGDNSTFSSSMANLNISSCSAIETAYLYWTGNFKATNASITLMDGALNSYTGAGDVFNVSATSGFDKVKFKIPGSSTYQTVTAAPADALVLAGNRYRCVADVTSIVSGTGGGQFWVADLQSYPNSDGSAYGGSASGWTLVVVFKSPLSPPRTISLWDGLDNISSGAKSYPLSGLVTPSSGNFKSYVGYGVLDAENTYAGIDAGTQEGLRIQSSGGTAPTDVTFNPFATDQPPYKFYNKKGYPAKCDGSDDIDGCKKPLYDGSWCSVYDGISSSHITSYNEITNKNGNEIVRLPTNVNTLGFDSHHMKLPDNSIAPGSTDAILTISSGNQGGISPFFAYIAIESIQPKLTMTKTADKNSTSLNSQITYTLRVKNQGNTASLGGDIIYDSLDAATNYVPGSLTSISYQSGVPTTPASGVSLLSSPNDTVQIKLANPILMGDSLDISFTVNVIPYASYPDLFTQPICKRTITNNAYIDYIIAGPDTLQSKSNANDCGIGSETSIIIDDPMFSASAITLGPFSNCSYLSESIVSHVRKELFNAGVAAADTASYEIRDTSFVRLARNDVFPATGSVEHYFAIRNFNSSGNCQQIYNLQFSCITCTPPVINSAATGKICSGVPQNYDITSDLAGTTYSWNRAAVANISNPAVTGRTSDPIKDTLINTGTTPKVVRYVITPTAAGCTGTAFNYDVTVNPNAAPVATDDIILTCLQNSEEVNIDVTVNDTDADADSIKVTKVFSSSGPMSILNDSTIKFSSNLSSSGSVSISYVICDKDLECPKCDTATISLCVEVTEVFIPNLVTPGNDSHNNTFQITGLFPNTTLKVYNTWGTLVFGSENYKNDWNPSGNSDGLYYYYLKDATRQKEWKGWVQVISDSK